MLKKIIQSYSHILLELGINAHQLHVLKNFICRLFQFLTLKKRKKLKCFEVKQNWSVRFIFYKERSWQIINFHQCIPKNKNEIDSPKTRKNKRRILAFLLQGNSLLLFSSFQSLLLLRRKNSWEFINLINSQFKM